MRALLLILMTIALVANVSAKSALGNGFTSGNIDTSGATLLVAVASWFNGVGDPVLTDSKSNTWAGRTEQRVLAGVNYSCRIYDVVSSPTVGSGHNFIITGTATFCSIYVLAFSGTDAFDQQNGANTASSVVSSLTPGSVTPGFDNEVLVAGLCLREAITSSTIAASLGFTITDQLPGVGSQYLGGAAAYLIETTAAAKNPQWSWTTSSEAAAVIATYKAAAGGATRGLFLPPNINGLGAGGSFFANPIG